MLSNEYRLRELVDQGPVDLDALVAVEQSFLAANEPDLEQRITFAPGLQEVHEAVGNPDIAAFKELGSAIIDAVPSQFTKRLGKSVLDLDVRQSVTDRWRWHLDEYGYAISLSTVASTVGLRGTVPVEAPNAQVLHITRLSFQNGNRPTTDTTKPQFGNAEVVTFETGKMIRITPYAGHSRPVLSEPGIVVPRPVVSAIFT